VCSSDLAALQDDLRRAGIEPWAWVVNASLAAANPSDPLLFQRAAAEVDQIESVKRHHSDRIAIVPWQIDEPVGADRLRAISRPIEREAAPESA